MDNIKTYAAPLGRLLMCSLFIWAGYTKLFVFGPSGTAGYMASVHMPLPALEPIRKLVKSNESDVIPCWGFDSLGSHRCGSRNTAVQRIEAAYVTQAI